MSPESFAPAFCLWVLQGPRFEEAVAPASRRGCRGSAADVARCARRMTGRRSGTFFNSTKNGLVCRCLFSESFARQPPRSFTSRWLRRVTPDLPGALRGATRTGRHALCGDPTATRALQTLLWAAASRKARAERPGICWLLELASTGAGIAGCRAQCMSRNPT